MPQCPPLKSGIILSPTSHDLGRITPVNIFPGSSDSKESACNVGDPGSIPQSNPWRRKWQPTPEFLPGKITWMEESREL